MEYLLRFIQTHETFRLPEIQALADLEGIDMEVISYSLDSPFCTLRLPSDDAARRLLSRSITAKAIYSLWGSGATYPALHASVLATSTPWWPQFQGQSFKFTIDSFQGSRTHADICELINSFAYMSFTGPVALKNPDMRFCVLEDWAFDAQAHGSSTPQHLYLGRLVGTSQREIVGKYDLKKRKYISTTSMDAELALITANIALARPGALFYDPFVGTGSFPVACAHFGALAFGSDIDGRAIRGKGGRNLRANFAQYDLAPGFGDSFVADLTNSPLRPGRFLDGIVCDPPYGVREGLKVLGHREKRVGPVYDGPDAHHLQPGYVPPKRPYSFSAMVGDLLTFAAGSLVENGRLAFWMPTANEEEVRLEVPGHPDLELLSVCTQSFNKWSRRLLTYRRRGEGEERGELVGIDGTKVGGGEVEGGVSADDLNPFRKRYFEGFSK
ncbi:hypothetical protein V496_05206 [Pseudogymnoascus sp. VKM F-4515 (FW-2607)]|nr:hypothetical protein V496_05206 [Pseudogymnoascus sp. VKM F-4515 (FW-2607)]KFY90259.1 hypothetical protein V498_06116 [Pseudogymnoascus sp. VKM F-4517 (FW-2822)]